MCNVFKTKVNYDFFQGLTVLFVGTMGLVGNVLAFATILSMSRPLREEL